MERVEMPIVVCGELKHVSDGNRVVLRYGTDFEVHVPALEREDIERMRATTNIELRSLHIDEIAIFINELGKLWLDEGFKFRNLAIKYASETTQYVGPSVYYDLGLLSSAMRRVKVYDMLESEIENAYYLEEWIPRQTVYRHAEPRGKVLHIMVGNIPMVGLFSILRSVLTKNVTIAKLPKRDILTSLLFAHSFLELDARHPITKSISAVYWEPGSPVEDECLAMADVVCAWGRRESIEAIKRKIPYGVEFMEFGPKKSIHLIGAGVPDYGYVAMKAAYDVSIYDQQACFSPQETFFEGDPEPYVEALRFWLERNLLRIPKMPLTEDEKASLTRARAEARFRGWKVVAPKHTGWTIVVTDGPCVIRDHPLNRTVYIHPVRNLREALPFVDKDTQTAAIDPPEKARALADDLVERGVARITEVGRAGRFRPGISHDGMLPMERMIRWVSIERGVRFRYKFWALTPEEDDRLFYGMGRENEEEHPMEAWKAYERANLK